MDTICLSLRGPPGSGKRTKIQSYLQAWATHIGQPYSLQKRLWDAPSTEQGEDGEDLPSTEKSSQAGFPMEVSVVHWGFDVARMSLQDKQYIKAILQRWGRGSQVLSTTTPSRRCLVFYHAHLLSSESTILLQAFLEMNNKDTVIWCTSEMPMPPRLADWFLEIPVKGDDLALQSLQSRFPTHAPNGSKSFQDDVRALLLSWTKSIPLLHDVSTIRNIVYSFLHRNIRWCEGFHAFLLELHSLQLPPRILKEALQICIAQPYTGPGQTVPSYRIPMLWENFLLLLRECLSQCATVHSVYRPPPAAVAPTNPPSKKKSSSKSKV